MFNVVLYIAFQDVIHSLFAAFKVKIFWHILEGHSSSKGISSY